ncbi:MAG: ankyrin repeat domain-containing protein [bacterium]|nr:ankyrin repeat domain-containing protein [Gemmatimonadota bacterium]HIL90193.1 ankyrin repeat domain-containing protein [Gemmatimonadota bacterium]
MRAWVSMGLCFFLFAAVPADAPIADASMRNDVAQVRLLVANGAELNAAHGDGMTGLHWAAENGNPEIASILLESGADVEAVTRLGAYRPLHLAARRGDASVIQLLLDASADPEAESATGGVTPLHFAAASGKAASVQALIDHGVELDARESIWGQTPLMFAAATGRTEVIRLLLQVGADPALTATVIDMPSRDEFDRQDQQARRARLAETEQTVGRTGEVRQGVTEERRPASSSGEAQSERELLLVQQRDRVNQPLSHAQLVGGYGGMTALLMAVRDGHTSTAFALLDHGVEIDQVSAGDHTSPLLMALINGHFGLAMELFNRGADPTIASDAGATPLYIVLNTEWIPKSRHPQPTHRLQQEITYLDLMKIFLEAGVDPNARLTKQLWYTTFGDDYLRTNRTGATPFWRAAYGLDLRAMRLLIEYGADPNIPTQKTAGRSYRGGGEVQSDVLDPSGLPPVPVGGPGAWPIHAASGIGYGEGFAANIHRHVPESWVSSVRYLIEELGADVNARDHNGYTALHHAAARGDNELILYLVSQGADVSVVSRRGQTVADMANGPVQRIIPFLSTVALLEGLGSQNNHNCVAC